MLTYTDWLLRSSYNKHSGCKMGGKSLIYIVAFILYLQVTRSQLPIVLNTWHFIDATTKAWTVLNDAQFSALDALVQGCSVCEIQQCDGTVGYGGSPDENGETTLDAMVMDGSNLNVGAVAGLRRVKNAISVAHHVLEYTEHTLLVGDQATEFAEMMGFKKESLSTAKSKDMWKKWKLEKCQPNFWVNVLPNPKQECGPYSPIAEDVNLNSIKENIDEPQQYNFGRFNHDTIGMIVINKEGKIYAGTSTNGAIHKIPGRVGDSPVPGAGAYADNDIGAATATGDGDIMMRYLPSFTAVENLRNGLTPKLAADDAIKRIAKRYKRFFGGLIVVNKNGEYAAACNGMEKFPFSVYERKRNKVAIKYVNCTNQ